MKLANLKIRGKSIKKDNLLLLDQLKAFVDKGMSKGLMVRAELWRVIQLKVEVAQGPSTIEFSENISLSIKTLFTEISSKITCIAASAAAAENSGASAAAIITRTNKPVCPTGPSKLSCLSVICQDRLTSGHRVLAID